MRKIAQVAGLLSLAALIPIAASAQATRTWVSGVGDDANPCSRTAPCKTFAGAISKTAPGGEINVLDPGGFGAVTITKAITISSEGTEAGVLVSGTNGIIINAPSTAVVRLRGLDFEGLGTGLNAITFLAGKTLQVENCTIHAFATGINFAPNSLGSQLTVLNTIITGMSGNGINVAPAAGGSARASLDHVQLLGNGQSGILGDATNGAVQVAAQATLAQNNVNGFRAFSGGANVVNMVLDDCSAVQNSTNGILAETGAGATVRFMNSSITGNLNGVNRNPAAGPSTLLSLRNNLISGNANDVPAGVVIGTITAQ